MSIWGINLFRFLFSVGLLFFAYSVFSKIKVLKSAKPISRFSGFPQRIKGIFLFLLAQKRLFYDPVPGMAHAIIFWGFCIISIESVQFFLNAFCSSCHLFFAENLFDSIYEIFSVLVLVSIVYALGRRLVFKTKRLINSFEGILILFLIFILVATGILNNILSQILLNQLDKWKIISSLFVPFFSNFGFSHVLIAHSIIWWIHGLVFLFFLNLLPYSKHMHILTILFNVFFRNLEPLGKLPKIDLEKSDRLGIGNLQDFTWKDILDGYTCTECGRCTERCPAQNAGKHLDPRSIILQFRDYAKKNYPFNPAKECTSVIENYIPEKDLWDCTTCHACVSACPVENEHLTKIIGMRRNLVLMEGKMPEEYQTTFKNLENNRNPWGIASSQRGDYAKELKLPLCKDHPEAEYLFFIGCAGSYDDRAKKIVKSFSAILQRAGVSFAVLGEEEFCCGDIARRMGNEYLFQEMLKGNKEILEKIKTKKIITVDAHCFNTLKNDYPDFGIQTEVYHHTEFIYKLMQENKLPLKKAGFRLMTIHDSCYLGRYNDIYEEPRKVLRGLNIKVTEMKNRKRNAFCCGAGGGRMWMEEDKAHRLNEHRIKEALATKAEAIVTCCPFCAVMLEDGLKDANSNKQVLDLAEIVEQSLAASS
jgi:Fe-S oxidoreductase/nitrate reductase gamma subunit